MKQRTLFSLSLLTALAGLVLLYSVSLESELHLTPLEQIDGIDKGNNVKIQGVVEHIRVFNSSALVTLSEPSSTVVVVFDPNLDIERGQTLEIIGRVEEYNGKKEVLADRIRIVKKEFE